ncbi:MAG: hypothetical protein HDT43_10340 [Ruminococcaceae bacterium]|nr:hypothetical protein [Oscillospiraceae bacterium]
MARSLLLKKKLKTAEELAVMDSNEVEQDINAEYTSYKIGEDWLLIPNDKIADFDDMAEWVRR